MAYTRQPNSVLAGRALVQNPPPTPLTPAGVLPVTLDAEIATTNSLGVVQVGSGLSITPLGVLSATGSGSGLISVTLVDSNYNVLPTDYYIGATEKTIDITLPVGVVGKVYIIKNQAGGNIKVYGSNGQKLDLDSFKSLGSESAIICVFDGTRWNII